MEYPNWFEQSGARDNFNFFLEGMKGLPIKALQIGAYTGDATKWLFENVLTHSQSSLVDVDTWSGSDEPAHDVFDWVDVEKTYVFKNASAFSSGRLTKNKMTSDEFFESNKDMFDFIYIDGDHTALQTLRDGLNGFKFLNNGGLLAFDDYMWTSGKSIAHDPKVAIDAVYACYADSLNVLCADTQVWLQKIEGKS